MEHLAILRKANIKKGDNLLGDILSGKKTVESRWYVNKVAPWNKIFAGENIYFKESGGLVSAKAQISKVLQFENMNPTIIEDIINKYGKLIAPDLSIKDFQQWGKLQTKKNYCILVFLNDVQKVKPFQINKTGFGISSAWLVVNSINDIKVAN